ncbi:MAG TPA: hypothetical protein VNU26_15865 [Mycobacteriales bacterium]|nr:hypothetical protein [Mycobacteriales bacterium]
MTAVPRHLAVLFLLALAGVLLVLGIVLAEVAGPVAAALFAAAAIAALAYGATRARRAAVARQPPSRRCTCCDGDHSAPVRVV